MAVRAVGRAGACCKGAGNNGGGGPFSRGVRFWAFYSTRISSFIPYSNRGLPLLNHFDGNPATDNNIYLIGGGDTQHAWQTVDPATFDPLDPTLWRVHTSAIRIRPTNAEVSAFEAEITFNDGQPPVIIPWADYAYDSWQIMEVNLQEFAGGVFDTEQPNWDINEWENYVDKPIESYGFQATRTPDATDMFFPYPVTDGTPGNEGFYIHGILSRTIDNVEVVGTNGAPPNVVYDTAGSVITDEPNFMSNPDTALFVYEPGKIDQPSIGFTGLQVGGNPRPDHVTRGTSVEIGGLISAQGPALLPVQANDYSQVSSIVDPTGSLHTTFSAAFQEAFEASFPPGALTTQPGAGQFTGETLYRWVPAGGSIFAENMTNTRLFEPAFPASVNGLSIALLMQDIEAEITADVSETGVVTNFAVSFNEFWTQTVLGASPGSTNMFMRFQSTTTSQDQVSYNAGDSFTLTVSFAIAMTQGTISAAPLVPVSQTLEITGTISEVGF